ncbi:hypothetical protein SCHPADRAFT_132870 [Schizopora paradoxa]|uniref:Uncharacterized protein n=1 Tax=Schizopora paradoxa TaxID=27342 RepID=A0A0H2S1K4_9AGAM|nr:hypothetical protein SCHPADRAFT_132870 [Schizopora paradoxa]
MFKPTTLIRQSEASGRKSGSIRTRLENAETHIGAIPNHGGGLVKNHSGGILTLFREIDDRRKNMRHGSRLDAMLKDLARIDGNLDATHPDCDMYDVFEQYSTQIGCLFKYIEYSEKHKKSQLRLFCNNSINAGDEQSQINDACRLISRIEVSLLELRARNSETASVQVQNYSQKLRTGQRAQTARDLGGYTRPLAIDLCTP